MPLGNCKLKQWDTTIHILEWPKSTWQYHVLAKMYSNRKAYSLMVGTQNGMATLEDSLAVSYKAKRSLTMWPSSCAPWYLPRGVKNLRPHKNLHTNALIVIAKTWKQPRGPSVNRWMDKQTVVHPDSRILFSDKKKWAVKPQKTWRNLKCILLSERSQSEKLMYCMIPWKQ